MPSLSKITAQFFLNLANRLKLDPIPIEGYWFSNVVQPVSLVDSESGLISVQTSQLLDIPFTTGGQVAPAINTILADTGAQVAGNYLVVFMFSSNDTANINQIALQRRDAANASNIWEQRWNTSLQSAESPRFVLSIRIVLSLNERLRCLNLATGGAGSTYQANIWLLAS